MNRYRKRPVEVEAVVLTRDNYIEVARWCHGVVVQELNPLDTSHTMVGINIPTMGGMLRASEGNVIQKGGPGMFHIHRNQDAWNEAFELINGTEKVDEPERMVGPGMCPEPGCAGDSRYAPPGKGHISGCQYLSIKEQE